MKKKNNQNEIPEIVISQGYEIDELLDKTVNRAKEKRLSDEIR